ncbi:MAG: multidrug effflux MFS transporter [Rubellimicrobium sp.]|nr:multidrug effflux MFS transporter [Rubellimicrobium sp.]
MTQADCRAQIAAHDRAATESPRRVEFIGLLALMMAVTAFGIDAMLPALPQIGGALVPDDPIRAQLVITSFIFGMGVGTFVTGPLSDFLGRKPVIAVGLVLYAAGALVSWAAPSMTTLLAGRLLMGLGASGPRVTVMAIVRDRFHGAEMARIMSLVAVVFMVVPAIAPSTGALIMHGAGWRGIFLFYALFATLALSWFYLRMPETLATAARRPVRLAMMRDALREMARLPVIRLSIAIQLMVFGMMFAMLSSIQGIFETAYDQGTNFPLWFMVIAGASAASGLLNSHIVMRIGILRIVRSTFAVQVVLTVGMLAVLALPLPRQVEFVFWMIWASSVFMQTSLTVGNVNALAMEPVGHIAGLASSLIAAFATIGSVVLAVPIGLASDGTPLAMALGVLVLAGLSLVLSWRLREG